MENLNPAPPAYDDEIDLWELWETIWSGRWLIVAITGVFALGGVTYALLAQEWYKAEVVLAPADDDKSASGALAQFGGLASLAGINLSGMNKSEPVAVLKSRGFARDFIVDLKLMSLLEEDIREGSKPLDVRDAVKFFDEDIRSVSEDKKTGLVTLSIRWKDPVVAASWANDLVSRLNARLRNEAEKEAERNVAYLQREISGTSVVSLQQSMGRVLEGQMQKLMLARGNEEFAFKIIDRATAPKKRDWPKRAVITLISFFVGGFLGLLAVFLRKAIANRPKR
jgi:uncharacterized protein involved in exopolysaccharide biosynthesis